ncbi:MAG: hypothetical protein JNK56_14190 [Myxococcales bacterium]|nr:hypothetical protein [Myxococcales bacterium]
MYILHRTRSMRLIVRPIGVAQQVVIENMSGNEGLEMQFSVRRSIGDSTSSGQVTVFNLPDSIRSLIEGQGSRVGNIDDLIEDGTLWSVGPEESDDEATVASQQGYATIELQAGYDEAVSTIFSGTAIFTQTVPTATSPTPRRDSDGRFAKAVLGAGITTETVIVASSGIAQVALSQANETFARGTDTFVILEHLRRVLKLGPGNCTPANWLKFLAGAAGAINKNGQSLFSQTSVLASSFTVTDNAAQQLEEFLRFTGIRYFVDAGELWLLPRQGFIEGPIVTLEPLKEAPRRPRPGHLECKAFLTPAIAPGHLVRVDATGIDTTSSGVYRCDEVMHTIGSSAAEEAETTVHLSRRQPAA